MKKCVFLTLDEPADFVIDDEHAVRPLSRLGWQVSTLSWRQSSRPWSEFDAVIIRSTWDYWDDVPAFFSTLEDINRQTRLANPLKLVRWNLEKTYLRDLREKGVGIVPTLWANTLEPDSFAKFHSRLGTDELVVKPVIGGNGQDVFRVSTEDSAQNRGRIAARFCNRDCMIQSFMPNITREGEYSLFFFGGIYSHAILKVPAINEFRSQEERGAEIRACVPAEKLLLRAQQAMLAIDGVPLYARIDFVRDEADDFLVMELELIEPSLYLRMDPEAPDKFAAAINQWNL